MNAEQALERLQAGNSRFVASRNEQQINTSDKRATLVKHQNPFAIILGCSDSRVPAELVFDQGLGDLFVIRVAGNIVAPSQVGSIEFAAERFGSRLVVVLGHSGCGAISATIETLQQPDVIQSRGIRSIVDRIKPSVETLVETGMTGEELIRYSVRSNIRASVNHLKCGSELLEQLIVKQGLVVVGAEYSLETGKVDFFDGISN